MMFKLRSAQSMTLNVAMIDTGMEMAMISADRPLRRKANRIITTRITACRPVSSRLSIDISIKSALLVSTSNFTSFGTTRCRLSSPAITALAAVTTLASLCRYILMITPSCPSI